jgi:cholesterol oxidase
VALANPIDELDRPDAKVDVIVIGSGYGAGVCAARLAQAGAQVVVLERGREFAFDHGKPFPETPEQLRANAQIDGWPFPRRHRLGLYNFHINRDLDVLVGCGLGGTSLINANVVIKPDPRVMQRASWPDAIRQAGEHGALDPYYDRAHSVLQPSRYPDSRQPVPRKLTAMLNNGGQKCCLNVHYGPADRNSIGVEQGSCKDCGDCITGCNFKAKKTLCFTYLPIAKSYGARIFVQCDVQHITRAADGESWTVHYQRLRRGDEDIAATHTLTARTVILGAGVLGTVGILKRSKRRGLALSDALGRRFSGNGDAFAFAYNCDERLDTVGYGNQLQPPNFEVPAGVSPVGAAILGVIDGRATENVDDGIIIEEGTVASGMAGLMRILVQAAGAFGVETQHGFTHWFHERLEEGRDLLGGSPDGALNRTLVFLLMGHDGADGVIELDDDERPVVHWRRLHTENLFTAENALARAITSKLGGVFVKDPLNTRLFLNNLATVHPLGGCAMANDCATGVVDHAGRVFSDDGNTYPGLYVADGSVIPTSLGANPLWTISAIAERIAEHAVRDLGLSPCTSSTLKEGSVVTP